LQETVEVFLLTKQIAGCTSATITTYRWWLKHFTMAIGNVTPVTEDFFVYLLRGSRESGQEGGERAGWQAPSGNAQPTSARIQMRYLLAVLPQVTGNSTVGSNLN
jgi:hypothetical protein